MGYPIKLNTKSGQVLFDEINKEFLALRGLPNLKRGFHLGCETDWKYAVSELTKFLDDDASIKKYKLTEDDVEGLAIYNNMHDECSVLNYFRSTKL